MTPFEVNLSTQCRADARQVVLAVPERVILNDELRGDRRAETQRKRRRLIQLVIRKCANCRGRLMTVPEQEFERRSSGHLGIFLGMYPVQLGDNSPCDVCNSILYSLLPAARRWPKWLSVSLRRYCRFRS